MININRYALVWTHPLILGKTGIVQVLQALEVGISIFTRDFIRINQYTFFKKYFNFPFFFFFFFFYLSLFPTLLIVTWGYMKDKFWCVFFLASLLLFFLIY